VSNNITTPFAGNETTAQTQTKLSAIANYWEGSSTALSGAGSWGAVRAILNNYANAANQINNYELASSFIDKLNWLNDSDNMVTTLFADGEQGAWYDASDFSTMFQDSAGTTPITDVAQPVGLILDKSSNGNHASQATSASRPILARQPMSGVRNLLRYTEEYDNVSWSKVRLNTTGTPPWINVEVAPDGSATAEKLIGSTLSGQHFFSQLFNVISGETYVSSQFFKADEALYSYISIEGNAFTNARVIFNLVNGTASVNNGTPDDYGIEAVGSGWYRCWVSNTANSTDSGQLLFGVSLSNTVTYAGDDVSGIYVWGAQFEIGSAPTAYQKVVSEYDVTEAGVQSVFALDFDGTDDSLETASIDFSSSDEMSVFAGVRKDSDAAQKVVAELSATIASNDGAFLLAAPDAASATFAFDSKGTAQVDAVATGQTAPITAVLSGLSDISADTCILRVNGVQADSDTGDQGTGNYGDYPLYIGRRGGSTLPFNGRLFSLIIRGKSSTASQITQAETWVNAHTGAY